MAIRVKKASGEIEAFSEKKVRESLKRAGAKPRVIDKILTQLIGKLYDGISTQEIYHQVFELLNQYQAGKGYHYSLKGALMQLGPSGFPFEKFIARLLDHLGYQTQTNVILSGKCLDHEIDVVAQKDKQKFMIECKYHNRPGTKTRSKDALYTQARFQDLADYFTQPWLVTNTKLTTNAIKYGNCRKMKLIAWRYPDKGSLEQLIEENNLHPLTCLTFLSRQDLQILFQNNLVLCQDLAQAGKAQLSSLGISSHQLNQLQTALHNLDLHQP
jgi:hypothetical protein